MPISEHNAEQFKEDVAKSADEQSRYIRCELASLRAQNLVSSASIVCSVVLSLLDVLFSTHVSKLDWRGGLLCSRSGCFEESVLNHCSKWRICCGAKRHLPPSRTNTPGTVATAAYVAAV